VPFAIVDATCLTEAADQEDVRLLELHVLDRAAE